MNRVIVILCCAFLASCQKSFMPSGGTCSDVQAALNSMHDDFSHGNPYQETDLTTLQNARSECVRLISHSRVDYQRYQAILRDLEALESEGKKIRSEGQTLLLKN